MRVCILGADGYLGWPTALHLSARGHDVIAVDNLVRRRWDRKLGTHSLAPISTMDRRIERSRAESSRRIEGTNASVCDTRPLRAPSDGPHPHAILHPPAPPSAPP